MSDQYKTIKAISEGIYKDKGSKFLSFAIPVNDVEEIKEILKEYRKKFFDARHVCYAYMLGHERKEFRANDDGEPSGTAGKPILGQINSRELTDILIIVVRYFGGVLLGTSGLITAYKEAANDALENAEIVEKTVKSVICICFGYELMNDVMKIVKETDADILQQQFDNLCTMKISVRESAVSYIQNKFENIQGLIIEN